MRMAINLILGGLGAGTVIVAFALARLGAISTGDLLPPQIIGAGLVLAALASVWLPVGRPVHPLALLARPNRSWAAWEAYGALVLLVSLAMAVGARDMLMDFSAAALAALYLFAQAMHVQSSRSRPAWRAREVPTLIVLTALASGIGMMTVLSVVAPALFRAQVLAPIGGIVVAAMGALRWRDFAAAIRPANAETPLAAEIDRHSQMVYAASYGVPAMLYLSSIVSWAGAVWTLPFAGLAAVASAAVLIDILIVRLGQPRDFVASPVGL